MVGMDRGQTAESRRNENKAKRALGLAGVVIALVGAACGPAVGKGSKSQTPPPPPLTVVPELQGLRVLLTGPAEGTWTDEDCAPIARAKGEEMVQATQASLSKLGFEIVTDASAPYDTRASFRTSFAFCRGSDARGTVTFLLEPGGVTRFPFSDFPYGWGGFTAPKFEGDNLARELVKAPGLAALAARKRAEARQHVVAQAAPPTEPVAQAASTPVAPASLSFLTAAPQPSAYAFIVGVEKYRDLPSPSGASADARAFADLAKQTLGIPESHVILALDDRASRSDLDKHLSWLKANVPQGGRIYFFFSGHGAPDPSAGTPYLVPYDGDPSSLTATALPLEDILQRLADTNAKDVVAMVDACFSGSGGRSVLPKGARPLARVKETAPGAQVVLLSASSGSEISGPVANGDRGLFSEYVVLGLGTGNADIDGDGQVSIEELHAWISPRVSREAKKQSREQNPGLVVGKTLGSAKTVILAHGLPLK